MSLYTFVNGEKKYIVMYRTATLTVNPTYVNAVVTFNTPGVVVGNSITVRMGSSVTYTLTADRHETRTLTEVVDRDKTVTPQMQLSQIPPTVEYKGGVFYQIVNWIDRGQCIKSGTYYYRTSVPDRDAKATWVVGTNARGEITSYSTSGNYSLRMTGTSTRAIEPTDGWEWIEVWE